MHILLAIATTSFGQTERSLELCDRIQQLLSDHGHRTDRITLPFVADSDDVIEQLMGYRLLDLSASAERLLTFDAPTHLLRHPNKGVVLGAYFRCLSQMVASTTPTMNEVAVERRLNRADRIAFSEATVAFMESAGALDSTPKNLPESLLATAFSIEDFQRDEEFVAALTEGTHRLNTGSVDSRRQRRTA